MVTLPVLLGGTIQSTVLLGVEIEAVGPGVAVAWYVATAVQPAALVTVSTYEPAAEILVVCVLTELDQA